MSAAGTLLAFGVHSAWAEAAIIAGIVFVAYLLTMWIAAVMWTYRDIQARTDDGATKTICVLLVAFFNLPGVLLYFLLRPQETIVEHAERQLEQSAFLREVGDQAACPTCQREIQADFVACPHCRAKLATPCTNCARNITEAWTLCPYCLQERDDAAPGQAAAAAASGSKRSLRPWQRAPRPQPAAAMPATAPAPNRG